MYKLLLCWRYLLTRYIALVSVVSVTLGVATMIVVNAVMLGFSNEMENRLHGVLSDVTVSPRDSLCGFENVDQRIQDVYKVAGDLVEAVTPTVATPALLSYETPKGTYSVPIDLIGIDAVTQEKVTAISQYLQHPKNREHLNWQLYENGYDTRNFNAGPSGVERPEMRSAGWTRRRAKAREIKAQTIRRQQAEKAMDLTRFQSNSDPNVVGAGNTAFGDPSDNWANLSEVQNENLNDANNSVDNTVNNPSDGTVDKPFDPYSAVLEHLPTAPPQIDEGNLSPTGSLPFNTDLPNDQLSVPNINSNINSNTNPNINPNINNIDSNINGNADINTNSNINVVDLNAEQTNVYDGNENDSNKSNYNANNGNIENINDELTPNFIPQSTSSPFDEYQTAQTAPFDAEKETHTGVILGIAIVAGNRRQALDDKTGDTFWRENLFVAPGDDITLSFLSAGMQNKPPEIRYDRFTVTDMYECRMIEYDRRFVFVPIEKLQELRGMIAPDGSRMASQLLIKAKPNVSIDEIRDRLRASLEFPPDQFIIETWRDNQEVMLQAVAMELSILNVLLFLIIAVAGFGILAIFFMIVVEKTRDIGIMKSLGASAFGVMQIFLYYGLSLGVVGAGMGLIIGLLFVDHINEIASFLSNMMGHDVFDPTVYMLQEVPAIIEPWTIFWIMFGAIFIAVVSGVLPALRAALLHPVDALRGS